VNVTVENLAPCKKLLRVEVPAEKVDETFNSITKEIGKQAVLPGFRPGKAPAAMVLRKYEADIADETKRKLISESYRKAVDEQKVDVIGAPDIEEIQFGRGKPLQFAATVETAPEITLPEYKGIEVKVEAKTVTDEDVTKALNMLLQQKVKFETADRALQNGDIAVVNYKGTVEGKPITELAPAARGIAENEKFWVKVGDQAFIPGFAEQLTGAKAGEHRKVEVDYPADFVTPQLQGKHGVYEVDVVEVKQEVLPPLDDAFAKEFGAENLEKLKEGVRRDLENELKYSRSRNIRNQIMRKLMDQVNFELPESSVARETRNVVFEIVNENQKRGISREQIEEHKDQIYNAANSGAKERVKVGFLLQKIAEKEDVKVANEEVMQRIVQMARMYNMPPEKFAKDLQKRNGMIEIFDQIMNQKVMDVLEAAAKVEEVPAGSLPPESPTPAA
jgi:trigger factor